MNNSLAQEVFKAAFLHRLELFASLIRQAQEKRPMGALDLCLPYFDIIVGVFFMSTEKLALSGKFRFIGKVYGRY